MTPKVLRAMHKAHDRYEINLSRRQLAFTRIAVNADEKGYSKFIEDTFD